MSWVKAVSHSEDVFDEYADDFVLLSKEWTSNMKKRIRDGYVDGIDAGEDAALQPGFTLGHREGAALTVAVGRLKGIVSAIGCWYQIHHPQKPLPASVTELLQLVTKHEAAIMEGVRRVLENPPPSVSSVSESMEDLEVKPAGPGCCGGDGGCNETDCCGGDGCNETDCCKKGEQMDVDVPHQPHKLSSGSTDISSCSKENLIQLLQRCVDLVSELGLPQELIGHIRELENK